MTAHEMTWPLVLFLLMVLTIALGDRRITIEQFTWWAVQSIAVALFVVGRIL